MCSLLLYADKKTGNLVNKTESVVNKTNQCTNLKDKVHFAMNFVKGRVRDVYF